MYLFLNILNHLHLNFIGVPKSLSGVRVIPNTVLMLITWREIERNFESPIINITIRYRIIDDNISVDDWNVLQVDPTKVRISYEEI